MEKGMKGVCIGRGMHGRQQHEIPAFLRRLDRQADRTRSLRSPLYGRAGLRHATRILDVGCGSGAVTADLRAAAPDANLVAIDVEAAMTRRAAKTLRPPPRVGQVGRADASGVEGPRTPPATVLQADGATLPFADGSFDVAVCNLVLLWAPDAAHLVQEMARVVRPGGTVLASMEPDYGGKIHWPENPLVDLVFQGEGIRRRGGDPHAGRKLRHHFVAAGMRTEVGILNPDLPTPEEDLQMMRRNRRYYRRMLAEAGFAQGEVDAWEKETWDALEAGIQLSFLPCFWAIGRKPVPGDVDRP